jgi:hypothetical protein
MRRGTASNTAFTRLAKMNVIRRFVNAQNVMRNSNLGVCSKAIYFRIRREKGP